jgi:hypothetical protein
MNLLTFEGDTLMYAKIGKLACSLALAASVFATSDAEAATCYYVNTSDQGDNAHMWGSWGWQCQQKFIDYWWNAFDFDKGDWDSGFGYEAPCDNQRPLARMFNSLYALGYSTINEPHCNSSVSNITHWAMCWSASKLDEVDGRCGSGTTEGTLARTVRGLDHYTEFYWPFFYGLDVSARAGTVFHEARHASGCGHNGGSSCKRGKSCDKAWGDGCREYRGQGANQFQVNYLAWYANSAWRTTPALRSSAVARANVVLANGYVTDPCIRISSTGNTYSVC